MHPNEALIRKGYAAFVERDVDSLREFLHPEVIWHVAGSSPLAGIYQGHEQLLPVFGLIDHLTDATFNVAAREMLPSDDHVVVLTKITAKKGDRVLDLDGVAVFKIVDGKAKEVWNFAEQQDEVDEFFAYASTADD
jgi:uncharacterized protein